MLIVGIHIKNKQEYIEMLHQTQENADMYFIL